MLNNSKYEFQKFNKDVKNKFIIYGDNIEESIQIINWIIEFNKDIVRLVSIEYVSLSKYVYILEIAGANYYFITQAYYRNGKLPTKVRNLIKELDKPDAIVYSVDNEEVLFGFEVTHTTLAGNATWQRTGRIINFLENKIPFAFIAYFSKNDKSSKKDNPRKPGSLFVLMYIILSLKYSTPALIGFFNHPDENQNLDEFKELSDWRVPIFKHLLCKIQNKKDSNEYLKKCYLNMKRYYFREGNDIILKKEFGNRALKYLKNEFFETEIIKDMQDEKNPPLFLKDDLYFEWKPKNIKDYITKKFEGVKFYQISKTCKAGITFEKQKIIDILNRTSNIYIEDYLKGDKGPVVFIPIKMTKRDNKNDSYVSTDDPYNGEISAFSNIYLQSFPNANILLLLLDHTKNNEYDVNKQKGRKIYKSINKYADLVIDIDFEIFDKNSEESTVESKKKYEEQFTTEDDVTSFFGTILTKEGIEPSFINPPCGSWSDIKLLPTKKYYYYNKNDERGDIAFFNKNEKVYYVGESKKNYKVLKKTINKEVEKIKKLGNIILDELDHKYEMKLFAIFKGDSEEAVDILENSELDHVVVVDDNKKVTLEIFDKE